MKLINFWRYWLPLSVLGLFVARCLYEINPLQWPFLGDWLTLAPVLIVAWVLGYGAQRLASRGDPAWLPPDLSPLLLLAVYLIWPEVDLRWALTLLVGSSLLLAQNFILPDRPRWFDVAVGALVLIVYLTTLGDHVGQADTFEFQVVAPQLGIAHPTGYPLFVILGKIFSLLPLGSMAWRVNLLSALFATLAVWLIYRVSVLLTSDRLAAALAALLLAASPVFWSQAVVAEVYALNALLMAAILYLLLNFLRAPIVQPASPRSLYGLFLLCGLALSHHLTSVILLPAIAITLFIVRPHYSRRVWLGAGGLLALGVLLPWSFLYLRWPALHNGQFMTVGEWLNWILGLRFGGALNLALWIDPTRWGIITRISGAQYGPIGLGLAAVGLIVLLKRSWPSALITAALFAGYFFYGLVYNVPDVAVFIIPALLVLAVWIGVGMAWLAASLGKLLAANKRLEVLRMLPYLLLAVLPLWQWASHVDAANQRGLNADQEAWGRYVLDLPIPPGAALLVDSEKIAPLYYLQVTEHLRPDLDIVVLGDETLYRQELDRRVAAGQPVYLARFLPNLPYRMRSLGPLVEVSREPQTALPSMSTPLNASFGDEIKLLGVTPEPGRPYRLTLYWQATSPQRPNYHVRLRLVDATGQVVWEDTGAHPVNGYYPTGAWSPGEVVSDFHEVTIAPALPAGTYRLEAGLFKPFQAAGLTVNGEPWLPVGDIQVVTPRTLALPRAVRLSYGQTVVSELSELGTVAPESPVTFQLNALGANIPGEVLLTRDRMIYETLTQTLHAGPNQFSFKAPEFIGEYELHLLTGLPARCRWAVELTPDCVLAKFKVDGEAIGDALNFDNQVLLIDSRLERDTVKPGETLKVDLTWQGLKSWVEDYTAFVHLIGPDGKVYGQVDQWPVQGTLPTSSWTAGQVVDDSYTVTLPPDAPRGQYQVEVGWYLLATLRRLNVLDSAGRPSDDRVIVGEFTVP